MEKQRYRSREGIFRVSGAAIERQYDFDREEPSFLDTNSG